MFVQREVLQKLPVSQWLTNRIKDREEDTVILDLEKSEQCSPY